MRGDSRSTECLYSASSAPRFTAPRLYESLSLSVLVSPLDERSSAVYSTLLSVISYQLLHGAEAACLISAASLFFPPPSPHFVCFSFSLSTSFSFSLSEINPRLIVVCHAIHYVTLARCTFRSRKIGRIMLIRMHDPYASRCLPALKRTRKARLFDCVPSYTEQFAFYPCRHVRSHLYMHSAEITLRQPRPNRGIITLVIIAVSLDLVSYSQKIRIRVIADRAKIDTI